MPYNFETEETDTRYHVVVKNTGGEVVGRGTIIIPDTGPKTIVMRQTQGGGNQGVFNPPIPADIGVLRKFVQAADSL